MKNYINEEKRFKIFKILDTYPTKRVAKRI